MTGLVRSLLRNQQATFLLASSLSTTGSFAGLTAKGWLILQASDSALITALNFAGLALPSLLISRHAGVLTDRLGCERVLVWAQFGLFAGAGVAVVGYPLTIGTGQVIVLLLSTLLVGVASTYELSARNKYCALVVDRPEQLGRFLASFSVLFNVAKLVGPPIGGFLVAGVGASAALGIDACSYLIPIATVIWILRPHREREELSGGGNADLRVAWRECGSVVRHTLQFTAIACLIGFFHPGMASVIARETIGPSPQDLGLFTSVLAAGSISGGLVLRHHSSALAARPSLLLGGSALITALSQLGMASDPGPRGALVLAFGIGAGTAVLLSGANLIGQLRSAQRIRGRVAGMAQIAFLGGGGMSGLAAASLTMGFGLPFCFGLLGSLGAMVALRELARFGRAPTTA